MTHFPDSFQQKCLPTYLVIDVSSSMQPYQAILNRTLEKLHAELVGSPRVSEFAQISIIAFSTNPWVVIDMTDLENVPVMPEVSCQGRTSYGEAFDLVRQCIDRDLPALKAQGLATFRPAVFFITDGAPTDPGWEVAFDRLVDRNWSRHPHVIAYGCGEAVEGVLARIGTKAAFTADGGTGQEEALASAISSLVNSLVASARAEELRIPEQVPGYRSVKQEYVD
jgi:uncharacterized protein YegL